MAHKTMTGGTAYAVTGGRTMTGGTAYGISGGRTMAGGTLYDVPFSNGLTLTLEGSGESGTCYIEIDGKKYVSSASSPLKVAPGTEVYCYVSAISAYGIYYNNLYVSETGRNSEFYYFYPTKDATIQFSLASDYSSAWIFIHD